MAFPEYYWYMVVSKPCTLRTIYYPFDPRMSASWRVNLLLALNRLLLNREWILINVLKALASIISVWDLLVIFLIEIYAEIFSLVNKRNVPSFQCKMRLNRSIST
jgi:hypothetical protein